MTRCDRREFVKLVSAALGGVVLVGCGGGGSGGGRAGTGPGGYRFYRVKSRGESAGEPGRSLTIDSFRGAAHLSRDGLVTFDAFDAEGRSGIFQVEVDLAAAHPTILRERTALVKGETLADGRVVSGFKAMDVNGAGSVAVDVVPTTPKGQKVEHYGSGLYLDVEGRGFEPVFTFRQGFLGGEIFSTGVLGDIDLHDDHELLVVGSFNAAGGDRLPGQGLFYLPGGSVHSADLLMASGDFVPSANHAVGSIGLIDLHDNGHYAVQGSALPLSGSNAAASGTGANHSVFLAGNLNSAERALLGAAPEVGAGSLQAHTFYGPRMTSTGTAYGLTWDPAEEHMSLHHGERVILATGDPSPSGGRVTLLGTGSVGPDDTLYYSVTSVDPDLQEVRQDLVRYDGAGHSVLLSRGDVLSDGGAPVEAIYFGQTTMHVDSEDRLVLFCTFTDGTGSLVIGLPA